MSNPAPTISLSQEERERLNAFRNSSPSRRYVQEVRSLNKNVLLALRNHLLFGQRAGGFVESLLRNKFARTALKADNHMKTVLPQLATYLQNMPMRSWGTEEAIQAWREKGGLYSENTLEDSIQILHARGL